MPDHGRPLWYELVTTDLGGAQDFYARVAGWTEAGGAVLNSPMAVPGGDRVAQCADPHGAVFALHSRAASA